MFKKLVSNLAYSPALVGQLGFYAKRLKKEEATRRLGLIFTALALVVQSFAVFSPPEAANASSTNDFIPGGFSTLSQYMKNYDSNNYNLKDTYNALGITRAELAGATSTINASSKGGYISWGREHRFSSAQGERKYTIPTAAGGSTTVYARPMSLYTTYTAKMFVGYSKAVGWFGLNTDCGIPTTKTYPPILKCPTNTTGVYPNCVTVKMCTIPGKTNLPVGDPRCKYDPVASCVSLAITPLFSNYQFKATASADHGAKVTGYTYIVKRDGVVVETKNVTSAELNNQYVYTGAKTGTHSVQLIVRTSLGDRTNSTSCVSGFTVSPPEMCPQNPKLLKTSPECQPCPGDESVWVKDEKCSASVIETKTANNQSQNGNAIDTTAKPSDRIIYSINVENKGLAPATVTIQEQLDDVLEYATVINNGSGNLADGVLTWPAITLKPGEKQTRMFTVQVLEKIPAMGRGVSDPSSYDCKMTNTFGNSVNINIECPVEKLIVEQTTAELPHTGPTENMVIAGGLLAVVAYFYARSRQIKKEVRLIRRDFNAGTI